MTGCSLLIATYNWPQALELSLKSAFAQSVLPSEIIVADDGSKDETRQLITRYQAMSPVPLVHVWQADEGFQLARIRNKGFAKASQDYIIQVDGDLVLHRHFISDHLSFRRPGNFVTGSRVLLSPGKTAGLFAANSIDIPTNFSDKNLLNRLHLPSFVQDYFAQRYKASGKHKYYVKGCNMAFWKQDLLRVNGYNEGFTGWGREDSEIAIRLMNAGVGKRFLKFGGVTYHLYHRECSREMEANNILMMENAIRDKTTRVASGMDQYL